MAGTTYQYLNNLISNIRESRYLEGRWTTDQNPAVGDSGQQVNQEEDFPRLTGEDEEEDEEEVGDNGTKELKDLRAQVESMRKRLQNLPAPAPLTISNATRDALGPTLSKRWTTDINPKMCRVAPTTISDLKGPLKYLYLFFDVTAAEVEEIRSLGDRDKMRRLILDDVSFSI